MRFNMPYHGWGVAQELKFLHVPQSTALAEKIAKSYGTELR